MSPPGISEPTATVIGDARGRIVSSRAQRVLTGAVAVPLALAVVFLLPGPLVLAAAVLVFGGAAIEFVRLVRHWAPSAPLGIVPLGSTGLTVALYLLLSRGYLPATATDGAVLLIAGFAGVLLVSGLLTLLSPTRMPEAMIGAGLIHFGIPYFALPAISVYLLAIRDPWLLALLLISIWVSDTFAYVFGSRFGRRKMAPVVSPNKSWEGAFAGLAGAIGVVALWCAVHRNGLDSGLIVVTAAAAAAGQLGDLLESMIKRGVGVKDSSSLLPGHGGLFDRVDAMLLAAPVFVLGLWLIGEL